MCTIIPQTDEWVVSVAHRTPKPLLPPAPSLRNIETIMNLPKVEQINAVHNADREAVRNE